MKSTPYNLASLIELAEVLANVNSAADMVKFLQDLCTPAELQAMSDRWRVVKPLLAGESYRQIQQETGVSVTTIGRVARCLTFGSGGYALALERTTIEEEKELK